MRKDGLTFVVLMGYNQLAENYRDVVLGRLEQGLFGRGLMALSICLKFNADYLLFTTGIVANGKAESLAECQLLGSFSLLNPKANEYLRGKAIHDFISEDTGGNLKWAKEKIESVGGKESRHTVVLVSDPAHMPRVMKEASQIFGAEYTIIGVQSDIPYDGDVKDVVVIEPVLKRNMDQDKLNELIKDGVLKMKEARDNPAKNFRDNSKELNHEIK